MLAARQNMRVVTADFAKALEALMARRTRQESRRFSAACCPRSRIG